MARFEAVADGIPVALLDVANEGMRLEIARGRRAALPPFFNLRVPLIGLSLVVQRVWVKAPGAQAAAHTPGAAARLPKTRHATNRSGAASSR